MIGKGRSFHLKIKICKQILIESVTETGNDCDVSGCTPVDQQSCLQTESLQGLIISTKPRLFFVTISVQLSSAIFTQFDPKPSTTTDVTGLTWPRENMWHFLAARRHFEMKNSTFSNHRIKKKTSSRRSRMFKILYYSKITISKFWFHKHFNCFFYMLYVRSNQITFKIIWSSKV